MVNGRVITIRSARRSRQPTVQVFRGTRAELQESRRRGGADPRVTLVSGRAGVTPTVTTARQVELFEAGKRLVQQTGEINLQLRQSLTQSQLAELRQIQATALPRIQAERQAARELEEQQTLLQAAPTSRLPTEPTPFIRERAERIPQPGQQDFVGPVRPTVQEPLTETRTILTGFGLRRVRREIPESELVTERVAVSPTGTEFGRVSGPVGPAFTPVTPARESLAVLERAVQVTPGPTLFRAQARLQERLGEEAVRRGEAAGLVGVGRAGQEVARFTAGVSREAGERPVATAGFAVGGTILGGGLARGVGAASTFIKGTRVAPIEPFVRGGIQLGGLGLTAFAGRQEFQRIRALPSEERSLEVGRTTTRLGAFIGGSILGARAVTQPQQTTIRVGTPRAATIGKPTVTIKTQITQGFATDKGSVARIRTLAATEGRIIGGTGRVSQRPLGQAGLQGRGKFIFSDVSTGKQQVLTTTFRGRAFDTARATATTIRGAGKPRKVIQITEAQPRNQFTVIRGAAFGPERGGTAQQVFTGVLKSVKGSIPRRQDIVLEFGRLVGFGKATRRIEGTLFKGSVSAKQSSKFVTDVSKAIQAASKATQTSARGTSTSASRGGTTRIVIPEQQIQQQQLITQIGVSEAKIAATQIDAAARAAQPTVTNLRFVTPQSITQPAPLIPTFRISQPTREQQGLTFRQATSGRGRIGQATIPLQFPTRERQFITELAPVQIPDTSIDTDIEIIPKGATVLTPVIKTPTVTVPTLEPPVIVPPTIPTPEFPPIPPPISPVITIPPPFPPGIPFFDLPSGRQSRRQARAIRIQQPKAFVADLVAIEKGITATEKQIREQFPDLRVTGLERRPVVRRPRKKKKQSASRRKKR